MKQVAARKTVPASIGELQHELSVPATPEDLAQAAECILSAYPHASPHDPDRYIASVIAFLSAYPLFVVKQVADPRVGIVTRCKFLPTIAELREAADSVRRPKANQLAQKLAIARQIHERRGEISAEDRAHVAERMNELRDTLKAKHGSDTQEPEKSLTEQLEELRDTPITASRTQCEPGAAIKASLQAERDTE